MYKKAPTNESPGSEESEEEMDMKSILKDIEYIGCSSKCFFSLVFVFSVKFLFFPIILLYCLAGSSSMSWKERKEMENRKAVLLGGKVKMPL